jgi:hypothetical protein
MGTKCWSENVRGRGHLEIWRDGMDSSLRSGSGHGPVVGSCYHGNELSGSKKCGEFLH